MNYIYQVYDDFMGDLLGSFTTLELAEKYVNSLFAVSHLTPNRFKVEQHNLDDFTIPDWI